MTDKNGRVNTQILLWVTSLLGVIGLFIAVLFRRRRERAAQLRAHEDALTALQPVYEHIRGLTKAEAAARLQEGLDNDISTAPRRTVREIWRENTLSIFNLSLLGIALVQIWLGKPLDVLLSLGVMVLNISLNVFQELLSRRRMKEVEESNRPKANVIRDGRVRSIDFNNIVSGDALVVGPGDRLFVDGEMVGDGVIHVDESIFSGDSRRAKKDIGDSVYGGSFCVSGRGVYRASAVGDERRITKLLVDNHSVKEELTPLERIIDRLLKIMLATVTVLMILLIAGYFRLDLGIPDQVVIDIASVIFSIAPAGLFFMILLTYTSGSADLAKMGALVHRTRSVEHLSQINVICFSKAGVLTGTHVELEYLEQEQDDDYLSESRIRQILGDYACSISRSSPATDVITRSLEGSSRTILEDAPFISAYGWSAVVFDDDDLSGVYVLAGPKLLALASEAVDPDEHTAEKGNEETPVWKRTLGRLGGLFNRSDDDVPESAGALESAEPTEAKMLDAIAPRQIEEVSVSTENEEPRPNIFRRTAGRLKHMFGRGEDSHQKTFERGDKDAEEKIDDEKVELVFAYSPNIQPLYDEEWTAILPEGLIPLCKLRFSEKVHPDTVKTLEDFTKNGVDVKIFSAEPPDETAELLRNAGWLADEAGTHGMISGQELNALQREDFSQAATDNTFFGQLTAQQTGDVVKALRENELYVALLGDGVNDVPAMQQADIKIAMHSSNQAVRSLADIILLQDSPGVLQGVLQKGQQIVNGLMDVLKLYVTQILYLTVLILAIQIVSYGFPYKSAQGGVIAVLTLTLPSLGLSLWASAGVLSGGKLGNILAQFFLPAGILIAATAMIVYTYFLSTYGDVGYAQLAVTYTLVGAGLILVLFLKPPVRILVGGARLSGDKRFIILVAFALLVFALLVTIPLSQELLKLDLLRQLSDYMVILLALMWYTLTLLIVWFIWRQFSRRLGLSTYHPV